MNLTDPTSALGPTLDGAILVALESAGKPLTVSEVTSRTARGSEIGIRRALPRLVEQGIVTQATVGRTTAFSLNRCHVAARAVEEMSRIRGHLWRAMSKEVSGWKVAPVYVAVFGSAARGDGDEQSDIDILLVRRPTQVEATEYARRAKSERLKREQFDGLTTSLLALTLSASNLTKWDVQVDGLREQVPLWTGNPVQIVEFHLLEWNRHKRSHTEFAVNVQHDAIRIYEDRETSTYRYHREHAL